MGRSHTQEKHTFLIASHALCFELPLSQLTISILLPKCKLHFQVKKCGAAMLNMQ